MAQTQTPALFYQQGFSIDYTPVAAVYGGDVVLIGTIPAVAPVDIEAGVKGAVQINGVYQMPKVTGALSAGDAVYWDVDGTPVTGTALTGAAGGSSAIGNLMGVAIEDAASGDSYVKVLLTAAKRTATIAGSVTADDITGSDSSLAVAGFQAAQGGAIAIVGGTSTTSGNAGGAITGTGGTPGATGVGGVVTFIAGAGGSTSGAGGVATLKGGAGSLGDSAGGAVVVVGGAGSATNAAGGAVSNTGGAGAGSSAGGASSVVGGLGGATGAGGAAALTGGAGGSSSGTGGAVTVTGGAGTAGNANGGAVTVKGGEPHGTGQQGTVTIEGARMAAGTTAVAITGATTLTLADSGGIFTVSQAAAYDIDLPSPTTGAGLRYLFQLVGAAANSVTVTVAGGAATFEGVIHIDGATIVATGATLTFASGASALGDYIEAISTATGKYFIRAMSSASGGITIA